MDPFTQGVLGAAFSQSFAKRSKIPLACFAGVVGGMAPDIDILIKSSSDSLLGIEFHRHFTHSLWFIPIGGLIVAALIWFIFCYLRANNKWSFKDIYLFTTLGYATHATLDACTSYGTRLFWPISNERVAWDTVAVIDPIPSLLVFLFVVLSYRYRSAKLAQIGMACMIGYLSLGFLQNNRVTNAIEQIAQSRGHTPERIKLNPTLGNLIVWRATYQFEDHYYVNAVIAQPFNDIEIIEGSSVATIDIETIYPELGSDSVGRNDLRRFNYFAEGYLFEYNGLIADLRYSAQPHKIQPIWGIELNLENPNQHASYGSIVSPGGRALSVTWDMLRGNFKTEPKKESDVAP
ncbi:MAG: metal-dependent hydrolase [Emcibacteraceae bacterium]|nr:metal-dependent hydrolase [Emcibacteraceae bacterium]